MPPPPKRIVSALPPPRRTQPVVNTPAPAGIVQASLFDIPADWEEKWKGMPDYSHKDLTSWQQIIVHLRNREDRIEFAKRVEQSLTDDTRSIWYPKAQILHASDKRYATEEQVNPRYPVYIISKGRWESRLTSKALEEIGVPYHIVIEPQEYNEYAAVIDPAKILQLPFSNLGQGSIPARNWVWEHAIGTGAERHWILDDNIHDFWRFNNNLRVPVSTGCTFRAVEDFTDRYENVYISGMNYYMFVMNKVANIPPFTLNTRIYSCILLRNDIPYRWRGRYNEDTDLSLRVLKDGFCTILFNAFLARKAPTLTMKGGNTDELYKGDGRLKMAQSLQEQHPDCVIITQKWGRPQHHVNYRIFRKNTLKLKPGVVIPDGTDNFGMTLKKVEATNE